MRSAQAAVSWWTDASEAACSTTEAGAGSTNSQEQVRCKELLVLERQNQPREQVLRRKLPVLVQRKSMGAGAAQVTAGAGATCPTTGTGTASDWSRNSTMGAGAVYVTAAAGATDTSTGAG